MAKLPEQLDPEIRAQVERYVNERISGLQAAYQAQINAKDRYIRELLERLADQEER